ncbi:hypothetical protein [Flavobacterium sp.]|uniref:hypothetical protein n=1 Tax=Flavobacterium sp. TaxID=239 RepID=UPI0026345767|nr:hypothetical protein [Flavobacterium sp.]
MNLQTVEEAVNKCTLFFKKLNLEISISEFDEDFVQIDFPREYEEIIYTSEDFLEYVDGIEDINFSLENVYIKNISQHPIFATDQLESLLDKIRFHFENEEFTLEVVKFPFLLGIANVKYSYYSKYAPSCTTYYALEIKYKGNQKLSLEEEKKIIKTFIFEYYQATNILLETTELFDFDTEFYGFEEEEEENDDKLKDICINELIEYNDSIESYLKAADTKDSEIKFLCYYKIIEFFSPKVAKLKAYEIMSRKLETIKYRNVENDDLNKLFEISDSYKKSKSDSELCKTVLSISVDIIDIFNLLPVSIIKFICKNTKLNPKDINYELNQENIDSIFQQLGRILYSTRNKIVHAKSNYVSDGFECKNEDLNELNEFLSKATFQILIWNNKLPKHSK